MAGAALEEEARRDLQFRVPGHGCLPFKSRGGPTAQKAAKGTMAAASSRKAALQPKAGAMSPPRM